MSKDEIEALVKRLPAHQHAEARERIRRFDGEEGGVYRWAVIHLATWEGFTADVADLAGFDGQGAFNFLLDAEDEPTR